MGTIKIDAWICTCDNCGEMLRGWDDIIPVGFHESEAIDIINVNSDWIEKDGKFYCEDCHTIDEDDNIIIDESRTNKYTE